VPHPFSPAYYLVVNNLGTPGNDAYEQANVITPKGTFTIDTDTIPTEDHVKLTPGFQFKSASATHHIFLVSSPVSYLCDTQANTLTRYTGYSIAKNQNARNTAAKLIAAGCQQCPHAQM